MYEGLGIHWASSIPAFLALACLPFPFLFYTYGPRIRKACKFSREAEDAMDKITRQSALPEGIEKDLRKVETNRSNLRREQTVDSRKQAERHLGLEGADEKENKPDRENKSDDIERDAIPPVPSEYHMHPPAVDDVPPKYVPEVSEKEPESGGIDPAKT